MLLEEIRNYERRGLRQRYVLGTSSFYDDLVHPYDGGAVRYRIYTQRIKYLR